MSTRYRADQRSVHGPITVELVRGGFVESRHSVVAAAVDIDGAVVASWGDPAQLFYPRSVVKPIQAMPLLTSGIAQDAGLGEKEIALACASHSGESIHVEVVARWLRAQQLSADDFKCGPQEPLDRETTRRLLRENSEPLAIHNNCSGKHAGFLTFAKYSGVAAAGYERHEHPVQQSVRGALTRMTGESVENSHWGVEGCGIPTIAVSLRGLALSFARLGTPDGLHPPEAAAARQIFAAMAGNPYLVGGRERFDTQLIEVGKGRLISKGGSEGIWAAAVKDSGIGFAVKVLDGSARAASVALCRVMRDRGVLDDSTWSAIAALASPPITNAAGTIVGRLRVGGDQFGADVG